MQHTNAPIWKGFLQDDCVLFRTFEAHFALSFLNQRTDDIDLPSGRDLLFHKGIDSLSHPFPDRVGRYRRAAGRQFVDDRHIQVAVQDERKRARDWGCRHDERVRRFAFSAQAGALRHAEAMLFIGHDCPQFRKRHTLLNERMRAHDDVCRAGHNSRQRFALGLRAH